MLISNLEMNKTTFAEFIATLDSTGISYETNIHGGEVLVQYLEASIPTGVRFNEGLYTHHCVVIDL